MTDTLKIIGLIAAIAFVPVAILLLVTLTECSPRELFVNGVAMGLWLSAFIRGVFIRGVRSILKDMP